MGVRDDALGTPDYSTRVALLRFERHSRPFPRPTNHLCMPLLFPSSLVLHFPLMGAERLSLRLAPSRALPTSLLVRPRLLFPATRSTLPVAFQTSILTTSQRYISSSRFLSNMSPTDEKQHAHVLSLVKRMVPPLSAKLHKGQAGEFTPQPHPLTPSPLPSCSSPLSQQSAHASGGRSSTLAMPNYF